MTASGGNDYIVSKFSKKYIQGLQVSVLSTTTLGLSAGECRDSTDAQNIVLPSDVTINFSVVGLNGIDTGSIAASELYYVFAIQSSLDPDGTIYPAGGLASLSATPVLPPGYDICRRVGWAWTGSGSTLLTMYQSGEGNVRKYKFDTMQQVLSAGAAQTLTAIDLSGACPPLDNMNVLLHVSFTPNVAADNVKFASFGSTATVLPGISGVVTAKAQLGQLEIISQLDTSDLPKILYINSAATGSTSVWVYGFEDVIV